MLSEDKMGNGTLKSLHHEKGEVPKCNLARRSGGIITPEI